MVPLSRQDERDVRCDCRDGAVGNGVRDEIVKMRSLRSSRRRCRDVVIEIDKGLSRRRDRRDDVS